ncbi:polysaccharide biosynthesis protein GtrA [Stenotrophomonas panacihumi]|uniref:Polysaccharide biosynthesis protein GtrA n=1 Tax=Stenotrophomonas panacihumi TaxID=676599 RepID=A0A0R0AH34_9GAMM|nr:GtrA family protein [Stenotrophomonas panacihumi]KRG43609.1 polysaccharide biosynthesis protein GtrA [Stenotrophomonas panacihumi]PTN55356.1 GtrA family protein [Stenotrophomonas panacihumi]
MRVLSKGALGGQFVRYVINGLAATAIHFLVLKFNLEVVGMASAGVANGVAAIFGITASFIGSRYFVFRGTSGPLLRQGMLFLLLYACIAALHALVMHIWADRLGYDYRIGFVLATFMQMAFSFVANKFMVFK